MVYEIYPILLERWDIIPNVFLYFCGRDDNTFSLVASFPLTCCCQAKARNAPCTSRDMVTEKRLRKNLEPSIHHSCLMMKVETLNPTNGRKNLYLITTEELLSRSFQYWWKEHTHTTILGDDNGHIVTCYCRTMHLWRQTFTKSPDQ